MKPSEYLKKKNLAKGGEMIVFDGRGEEVEACCLVGAARCVFTGERVMLPVDHGWYKRQEDKLLAFLNKAYDILNQDILHFATTHPKKMRLRTWNDRPEISKTDVIFLLEKTEKHFPDEFFE